MALLTMTCPYCGGKLKSEGDHYTCPYCGNDVVYVPDNNSTNTTQKIHQGISISIKYKEGTKQINFNNDAIITCESRKRATMADPQPMSLIAINDGYKIILFEYFENVGKGQMIIKNNETSFVLLTEGKINVNINGTKCQSYNELNPGDTITIGEATILLT